MGHLINKKARWSDYYTRQAKIDRYPARAVYKLKEIQEKYKLLKKGDKVLDLGCAPGSWLVYTSKIVGYKGLVVGIDLNPIKITLPQNALIFKNNILDFDISTMKNKNFNSVISDMAPYTTGNKDIDNTHSLRLCCKALDIANSTLVTGGMFVCKIFQSNDVKDFSHSVKKKFSKQLLFKPKSSRKKSREIYVIGLKKF